MVESLLSIQGEQGMHYTNDVSEEFKCLGPQLGDSFLWNNIPIVIDKLVYLSNDMHSTIQFLEMYQKEGIHESYRV